MRLYKFTKQKYGLQAIKKRRLKIARVNELNDPFEFMAWNVQERDIRAKLRAWKNEQNGRVGIVCFSREWSNPLLWSHYADGHRGMALGFEVPEEDIYHPVRYQEERLPFPSDRVPGNSDVDDVLLTKFDAWRYETEYRCFCILADSIPENGLYFEPFSDVLRLVEVLVGERSMISRDELAAALGQELVHVKSRKVRPAFGTFDVVYNLNDRLWK